MPGTRKLGKTTDQRRAMLRQQVTDFLDKGRMETTVTRAKEADHKRLVSAKLNRTKLAQRIAIAPATLIKALAFKSL